MAVVDRRLGLPVVVAMTLIVGGIIVTSGGHVEPSSSGVRENASPSLEENRSLEVHLDGDRATMVVSVEEAEDARFSLAYTLTNDGPDPEVVGFVYPNGPRTDVPVVAAMDSVNSPTVRGGLARQSLSSSPVSPELLNGTEEGERHFTLDHGPADPAFVFGLGLAEDRDLTVWLNWTGAAEVETRTLDRSPVAWDLADLDAEIAATSRFGPTIIEDARGELQGYANWVSTTQIVFSSADLTYCVDSTEDVCRSWSDAKAPGILCLTRQTDDRFALSLSAQSQGPLVLASFTVPPPHPGGLPANGMDPTLTCEEG
jgi:hypothetical protein